MKYNNILLHLNIVSKTTEFFNKKAIYWIFFLSFLFIPFTIFSCNKEDPNTPTLPEKPGKNNLKLPFDNSGINTFVASAKSSFKRNKPDENIKTYLVPYTEKIVNNFKENLSDKIKENKTETFKLSFSTDLNKNYSFPDPPMFLDFNTDGKVDLAIIPEEFFGPSEGYGFYKPVNGKWTTLFEGAGKLIYTSSCNNYVYMLYAIDVIANYEPYVYVFIRGSRSNGSVITNTFFVPPLTSVPQNLKISPVVFNANISLRMDPSLLSPDPNKEEIKELRFIQHNIIAKYDTKSNGYILNSKGIWHFVCLSPSTLKTSSLCHGMTPCIWNETEKLVKYPASHKPWICAWTEVRTEDNK
ncbi:hypothetical protein KKF34_13225 [Myxococcota bacterium]|nr:hypothetical protein [Myxococcota bacterium]MBU1381929.1 hypothetical protein [Myxococcota bacterium]MBU1497830.1 hypothetical protein [Myxococcota bacterium]